jgi:hypothetical protein
MAPDGSFSIYVGEKLYEKVFAQVNKVEGLTSSFIFCYQLTDESYESGLCSSGRFPLFSVNTYSEKEYNQVKDDPLFKLSSGDGYRREGDYFYTVSHPNGEMPEEITSQLPEKNWEEYYITVLDSLIPN